MELQTDLYLGDCRSELMRIPVGYELITVWKRFTVY